MCIIKTTTLTNALPRVAYACLIVFVLGAPWNAGLGQQSKVVIAVEDIKRIGQDEARIRVIVTNTSSAPVYSTGIRFDPRERFLTYYWEQKTGDEIWQHIAPCMDTQPPHIIELKPAAPIAEDLTLRVPLGRMCKKRDIKLDGQFRFRVDYFERRKQAWRYLERFFADDRSKPRPASAYSELFEIPSFQEPIGAKPRVVQGLVTDEADASISGAAIELDCSENETQTMEAGTKSGTDGRFEIKAILRGVCKIRISHAGFSGVVILISQDDQRAAIDLGRTRLRVSCSGPGVICDEVTPR